MRPEWKNRSLDPAIRLPEDVIIYGCGVVVYFVLHYIVKQVLAAQLIKRVAKDPKKVDERKFTRALWKAFCFGGLSLCGAICLYGESWMLTPLGITLEWPNNETPSKVNIYYVIETVYYTGSFITMFLEEKQSDFYLMIWHHFATLVLVGFSYRYNFLRYGVFIMFLHDISDPWMDSAKIAVYLGHQTLGNIMFIIFAFMFIIPRIFVYLVMILIPGYGFLWEFGSKLLVPIWGLLLAVFVLNAYWSVLIVRMALEFIKKGRVEKDIRDIAPSKKAVAGKKEAKAAKKAVKKAEQKAKKVK
ncbi:very-long-chain ceramide synthase [Nematocida major]|uniref:very-long-chain ceramide synthase n=1 Tax=Nematocida major TaxID=1912982 RepID=UPI0020085BE8|nr:very-long-chain ceramide synthase [Nematocida major]KAH9386605.1 very-long-chain ceramide synthase [Nematocida major]